MTDEERTTGPGVPVALTTLVAVVSVALIAAVIDGALRPWVVGVFVPLLDGIGVVASWRAARRAPGGRSPWRLIAGGRAASVLTTVLLVVGTSGGEAGWQTAGSLARLLMYVLLAAGVLSASLQQVDGRSRWALITEVTTVLAAGFMVVWYFAIDPIVEQQARSAEWWSTIGWPIGDLFLLAAVASMALRGAVNQFSTAIAVVAIGLAVHVSADITWLALQAEGRQPADSPVAALGEVLAGLLLTAAAMLASARPQRLYAPRTGKASPWGPRLPLVAMLVGCLLLTVVTLLEKQLLPWGGLVGGLSVMTCAAAARQLISLRESRELVVTDALTGLANRAGLDTAIDRAARRGEPLAVLLIDLDGFKLVNDAYGHAAGDRFLIHFAHQLAGTVRAGNTVARIGGDEFAVLLPGVARAGDAEAVAGRILIAATDHPIMLEGDIVPVRASIGVALAGPGDDSKALLRHADLAMYHSKRTGSHGQTLHHSGMVDRRAADAALADDLDNALQRDELHLLYQPLVDLASGRPVAAEALIRWQHPVHGLISPVQFIPIAERSGAIISIGLWTLERALTELLAWQAVRPALYVSVNLSPRQLREPTIVHDILAVLDRAGADPQHLVLEVTESALVDESSGLAALRTLRTHGIRIAIDDFGTGYSSLQYLTRLPVDVLKVDRSFVAELNGTAEGAAVTDAIIRLAQVLHLTTVGEGIETEEQARELQALGCVTGQGFLYAKPLPPAEARARLTAVTAHRATH